MKPWKAFLLITPLIVGSVMLLQTTEAMDVWVIDGDRVYVDNSKVFIQVTPHTVSDECPLINVTPKTYTGDVDIVFGFDTNRFTPRSAELYDPHIVNTTRSFTCDGYFNYTYVGKSHADNHFWCWNTVVGTVNETNPEGTYHELYKDDWFEWGNIPTSTAYWNESTLKDYRDISGAFTKINKKYKGMDVWYYKTDIPVTAGENYQIRACFDVPIVLQTSGKWSFGIKPSGETLQEAIDSGHFYYLDPWWNAAWGYRQGIRLTNTAGDTEVRVNEPIEVRLFSTNLDEERCNEAVRILDNNSAVVPFYLVANQTNECNVTFLINISANTEEYWWAYYANAAGTDQEYSIERVLSSNFENYTNTAAMLASGWLEYEDSPQLGTTSCPHGNNCLELKYEQDTAKSGSQVTFAPQANEFWYSFWARASSAAGGREGIMMITDDPAQYDVVYLHWGYPTTTKIGWYSGGWTAGPEYSANDLHVFKFWVDAADDKFSMEINTSLKINDAGFVTNRAVIDVLTFRQFTSGTTLFDDIEIWNTNFTLYGDPVAVALAAEESGAVPDTCTYDSGDWAVECSDGCVVTDAVDVGGNDITLNGTGTFYTSADITSVGKHTIIGTDVNNKCTATCDGGCFKT